MELTKSGTLGVETHKLCKENTDVQFSSHHARLQHSDPQEMSDRVEIIGLLVLCVV